MRGTEPVSNGAMDVGCIETILPEARLTNYGSFHVVILNPWRNPHQ